MESFSRVRLWELSVVSVVQSGIDSDLSFLNVYRIPKLDSLAHCTFAVVHNPVLINLWQYDAIEIVSFSHVRLWFC